MDAHRLAELRSLAYHRLIAQRLADRPELRANALGRAQQWLMSGGPTHPTWASAWVELLAGPLDVLIERLGADDEPMRALRQCTPFAGAITPQERWALHRQVRQEESAA